LGRLRRARLFDDADNRYVGIGLVSKQAGELDGLPRMGDPSVATRIFIVTIS
jgi:hypothetical protein